MGMELVIRFDYGCVVPWVRQVDGVLVATAGPHTLELRTKVPVRGENMRTVAEFRVKKGKRFAFTLGYHPSFERSPRRIDPLKALARTQADWRKWSGRCTSPARWHAAVSRSLITLKALTFEPTGGIVAAPTTSLPEQPGGARNWDYRYCWLRDATLTLLTFMNSGYYDEAQCWRDWLLRAAAGSPSQLQIMYGVAGEKRLTEWELAGLSGYERSKPGRIGNAAAYQLQLDVFGEVMDALHQA